MKKQCEKDDVDNLAISLLFIHLELAKYQNLIIFIKNNLFYLYFSSIIYLLSAPFSVFLFCPDQYSYLPGKDNFGLNWGRQMCIISHFAWAFLHSCLCTYVAKCVLIKLLQKQNRNAGQFAHRPSTQKTQSI